MSKNLNQRFFAEFITVLALTVNPDPNIEPEEPEIYLTEEDLERRRNGPASRASSESSDSSENSGGGSGDGEEGTTVWKCHDFSITENLREINFRDCRSAKSAILTHLEGPNFDFYGFLHFFKAENHQINQIQSS